MHHPSTNRKLSRISGMFSPGHGTSSEPTNNNPTPNAWPNNQESDENWRALKAKAQAKHHLAIPWSSSVTVIHGLMQTIRIAVQAWITLHMTVQPPWLDVESIVWIFDNVLSSVHYTICNSATAQVELAPPEMFILQACTWFNDKLFVLFQAPYFYL